jgi:hypothetical protein
MLEFATSAVRAADEAWGSAKWVLEGAAEPLSGKQRKVVAEASGAYSAAVEASLEASLAPEHEKELTVGGYLRDAWPQARRSPTLRTLCSLVAIWKGSTLRCKI